MMLSFALALLGPLSPPASAALPAEDQLSLEELLEHYRQRREQLFQELRGELKRTVAELESAYESGRKERLPELRRRLVKLGPEAVPLFLDQLDPGSEAQEAVVGRCRQVALALKELSTKSVSLELIALFKTGSREGQRNALTALSGSDDPERVGPVLREEFTDASKRRRDELISAIANLGGEENFAFIGEILSSNDPDVITSALVALTESRCVAAGPRILGLINETVTAAAHVPEIVAYYRACPEVVDEEHVGDLVRFSKGLRSNTVMSALVLKLVGEHEDHWNSKIKKDLRELSEASSRTLAEAALMCLARAGDRGAKRKLLERYDELVERNERIASNWQRRAEVKFQIGEYKGALKDFQQARRTSEEYLRTDPDIYIGMARCFMKLKKPKDAVEMLYAGGLSIAQLHLLAKDPDFMELLEDSKLRKVFRLEEE